MYLTVSEAAARLGVSQETIRRWCRSGKIPCAISSRKEGYVLDESYINWRRVCPDYSETTGGRLRTLRKDRKLSVLTVSMAVSMDPNDLSAIERNRKRMSINVLKKLCRFYDVSADYILCLDVKEDTNEQEA